MSSLRHRRPRSIVGGLLFVACLLGLVSVRTGDVTADNRVPTYAKDVAPILNTNCVTCHRPGEVAPFSLMTYKDAVKYGKAITAVTQSRFMPPWKPEPGYGEFKHSRRLADDQIDVLRRWVATGMKPGNASDTPPTPKFNVGWQLGEPDLIVRMPQPFTIPADGPDIYQCFVIPLQFSEDRYVTAYEYKPGNKKVVHHALFYLDDSGAAREMEAQQPDIGYRSYGGPGFMPKGQMGGWAPGAAVIPPTQGIARVIPRGTDLVIQNHYHPSGKPESDESVLGLYFSKTPPTKFIEPIPLIQLGLDIPAGEKRYKATSTFTAASDLEIAEIAPHMHTLGREMKIFATTPDGTTLPMIWIKDWDFNWQGRYQFREPVRIPKGSKVTMEAYYDNSAENPRNPNSPPKRVLWGEETTDEMALCYLATLYEDRTKAQSALRMAFLEQIRALPQDSHGMKWFMQTFARSQRKQQTQ